jgi:hypothetical protein
MKRNQTSLVLGIASIVVPLLIGCGAAPQSTAQEEAPGEEAPATATHEVEYLFVLTAESATLTDGVLTMGDVNPATLYFSDRPDRLAGHETTEDFVASWGEGDDSFASNPPNATLSVLSGPEPQDVVVVLSEPRLEDGDLVFAVSVLEGNPEVAGGANSLFIDIIGRPLTPVSAAGVARRTTRRAFRY